MKEISGEELVQEILKVMKEHPEHTEGLIRQLVKNQVKPTTGSDWRKVTTPQELARRIEAQKKRDET